jgi:hypothetical protein
MGRLRYALAVSSVGEPLQRKVMNPATVEHLFIANNKLPVYYYVCVKQQAQKKVGMRNADKNRQTHSHQETTHLTL